MGKICPKCNKEWPDDFMACPLDGTPLISKTQQPSGLNLNLGDANAISGGVNMSDNHSVSNNTVNNTTSTVDSHNVITTNITQVEREKSAEELKHERELEFREACIKVYNNGIMTSEEKRKLDDLQYRLGLDEVSATKILTDVSKRSERKSATLSPVHQITFNNIKSAILANRLDMVNRLLAQMKAMVQRYSTEDIQYTYYMLQAVLHPNDCIEEYEIHKEDKYWQSFWSSIAYRRVGNIEKSEILVADVGDKWVDTIPQDNVWILASANALLDNDIDTAKSLYDNIMGDHSPLLSNLATCLYTLLYGDTLESDDLKKMEKDAEFFTNNLFGSIHDAILSEKIFKEQEEAELKRQEEERILKEQEEAEHERREERIRKEQEEAELQRHEEERIRREQEDAELKRQEEERILKEQEEAELKGQEEERILKEQEEAELKRQEDGSRQNYMAFIGSADYMSQKQEEKSVPNTDFGLVGNENIVSGAEALSSCPTAVIEKIDIQRNNGNSCHIFINLSFSVSNMQDRVGYIEAKIYSVKSNRLVFNVVWSSTPYNVSGDMGIFGSGDLKNHCFGFVSALLEKTVYQDFCISSPIESGRYNIPANTWTDYRVEVAITDINGNHISDLYVKFFKVNRIAHTFKKDEFQIELV